jgi:hypothetical protein
MTANREVRGGIPAEIRADSDGIKVSGYAARSVRPAPSGKPSAAMMWFS